MTHLIRDDTERQVVADQIRVFERAIDAAVLLGDTPRIRQCGERVRHAAVQWLRQALAAYDGMPSYARELIKAVVTRIPDAQFECSWLGGDHALRVEFRHHDGVQMMQCSVSRVAEHHFTVWDHLDHAIAYNVTTIDKAADVVAEHRRLT